MQIAYVGHATVLLEASGTGLLTDPVLRSRVAHLRRYAPPARVADARRADAVLISHVHHDHLDLPSLRALPVPKTLVGPIGLGRLAGELGADVIELSPGEHVRIGALTVRATHADHVGRRLPWRPALAALGFVVEDRCRVYFAGDTDLFDGMAQIGERLDVALLPVSGWGARVGPGHLDPERAARAVALLAPRLAIPIHWGTYASPRTRPRHPAAPALEFARRAAELAPEVEVRVLHPGEQTTVGRSGEPGRAAAAGCSR